MMGILLRCILAFAAAAFLPAASAHAQSFPANKPVTIVVSYPPGGLSDFYARLIGSKLSESLKVAVVVENRPGANGTIGTAAVARANPDGHTITLVPASTLTTNQWIMKDIGFDPVNDLTPISLGLIVPNVLLVNPSVEPRTVPELVAWLKQRPGKVNYASVGIGSSTHLNAELFKTLAGVDMVHVPYKGAAPAIQDVVAGQVQLMFDNLPAAMPLIQGGKLRALAVTSVKASPSAPEIPPMGQFLPGYESTPWFGFLGPKGMPKDVVAVLNDHLTRAAKAPDVVQTMKDRGGETVTSTSAELGETIRSEGQRMKKLLADAKVEAQ